MNFYKHYLEVKKQHPDALVLYRVGDFYELFDTDAVTASEVLNLTLTGRDCGLPERVPMCGVPHHSVDTYIAKLIECGYKTAICEPSTELPKVEIKPIQAQGRLNLTANGTEQTTLKEYLEANASEVLTEKINNGVKIVKDSKTLINKKTLETFLVYACEEARKLAEKGARSACVKDDIVFGWLVHYFEESSIEGTLYNEDGSEYKPKPAPRTNTEKTATVAVTPPKPKTQFSLFDMLEVKPMPEEPKAQKPETEEDYPKDLHQVSETEWADADSVIYEVTETKKEAAPDALIKLFGDLLIVR